MQRKSGRTRVTRLPQEKVYHLLEPGPVVLLTTSQKGKANVMTMSWHMMMDFVPPRVACVVSEKQLQFHRAPSHQRVRYRGAARRVGAWRPRSWGSAIHPGAIPTSSTAFA